MESDLMKSSNIHSTYRSLHIRALCVVCGAPAIGRNFDAMTCLSCKAFFRRNAYNEHLIFTCRISNSCEITSSTRRHCSACRLRKCFEKGMKKDLIRSLTAISHATSVAMANRSQNQMLKPEIMKSLIEHDQLSLSIDEWNFLTNIPNIYEEFCIQRFIDSHRSIPLIPPKQPYRARIKLQRLIDLKYKYTTIILSFVHRVLQYDITTENHYKAIENNIPSLTTINISELMNLKMLESFPWEHDQLVIESVYSEDIIQHIKRIIIKFQILSPYDPYIVKLLLIILSLSTRTSPMIPKSKYTSFDFIAIPSSLIEKQNYYMKILWKYMIYRLGYYNATMYMVRFMQNFLRRQAIEGDIMDVVGNRGESGQLLQMNFNF